MNNSNSTINHIALYVTNLERSIQFYQEILHMQVYGPVHLGSRSASGRLIGKVAGGQSPLKGIIGSISSRALQDQYTDVALLSSSGAAYDILLIQKRYPETNVTRSVDGCTIFGFSCFLSSTVDPEILGWDLHQAEADFVWGDPGFDGTIYTNDCPNHSLYIREPDGRMIELLMQTDTNQPSSFITGLSSITLHTTYPDVSKKFYQEKLRLAVEYDSAASVTGKRFIRLKNAEGKRCILLLGQTKPDGNPVKAGGYGLDHFALTGYPRSGEKKTDATDICMDPERLAEQTGSSYMKDPDGYWIECM
ncbi:MAG TPA: VOC family protein [Methanospirillum sp.]|nr:VOC family protein [Methanospirillum sp.]HOJ95707.1 VOC family protein [Methanospirillum sp.]HOL40898.1 VOC family protein [Methanospirillum sp.]HPP77425.1 VOC family protein [Methanospirillum sp.]